MNCITIKQLNTEALNPQKMVADAEKIYAERISNAAEIIFSERVEKPVVLVSGPSGSGKTTSASRIARLLKDMGCGAHTISMDNYFKTLSEKELELASRGEFDFESPMRLDVELFKAHIEKLSRNELVEVPAFDFARQQSIKGMPLQIPKGDIVIIEGIHALNPLVTGDSESYTNCVYVSVRTRIEAENGDLPQQGRCGDCPKGEHGRSPSEGNLTQQGRCGDCPKGEHGRSPSEGNLTQHGRCGDCPKGEHGRSPSGGNLLHPSKIRLMRRLIRDKLYRGRTLPETFEFFRSVEEGEEKYIMPFKYRADFDIDTFIPFEPLVYRDILLPELALASETYADYERYADIERFLKQLSSIDRALVPENSLIKEFIG